MGSAHKKGLQVNGFAWGGNNPYKWSFYTRWWLKNMFMFTLNPGEMIQFDVRIFFNYRLVQPQTSLVNIVIHHDAFN